MLTWNDKYGGRMFGEGHAEKSLEEEGFCLLEKG